MGVFMNEKNKTIITIFFLTTCLISNAFARSTGKKRGPKNNRSRAKCLEYRSEAYVVKSGSRTRNASRKICTRMNYPEGVQVVEVTPGSHVLVDQSQNQINCESSACRDEIAQMRNSQHQPEQIIEQPEQVTQQSDQITQQPEQVIEQPDQIIEQPDQIIEQPNQITQQPDQIIEQPDQINPQVAQAVRRGTGDFCVSTESGTSDCFESQNSAESFAAQQCSFGACNLTIKNGDQVLAQGRDQIISLSSKVQEQAQAQNTYNEIPDYQKRSKVSKAFKHMRDGKSTTIDEIAGKLDRKLLEPYCDHVTNLSWDKMVTKGGGFNYSSYTRGWSLIKEAIKVGIQGGGDATTNARVVAKAINYFPQKIRECGMYVGLTSYTDPEDNPDEDKITTLDGKIKCVAGPFALPIHQDYAPCASFANAYDGAIAAKFGLDTVQQVQFMKDQSSAQFGNNVNEIGGALNAQKNSIQSKLDLANQQAAFHGGKLGILSTFKAKMPTRSDLVKKCKNYMSNYSDESQKYQSALWQALANALLERGVISSAAEISKYQNMKEDYAEKSSSPDEGCLQMYMAMQGKGSDLEDSDGGFGEPIFDQPALLVNKKAQDAAKAELIATTAEVAKYTLLASMFKKQIGKIDKALADIEEFAPSDLAFNEEDLLMSRCALNPLDPECAPLVGDITRGFDPNQNFNIGGGTGTTSITDINRPDLTNDSSDISGDDGSFSPGGPISFGTPGNKDNGPAAIAAGASIQKKGSGGGAGGGGGGGGGAAGGGGGGAPAAQGANARQPANAISFGKAKYNRGGGVLYRSKASRRKKGSSNNKNPFASMFKKNKGSSNGTLNFRDPAAIANKSNDIFKMISKRYSNVAKDKRLMEYELK